MKNLTTVNFEIIRLSTTKVPTRSMSSEEDIKIQYNKFNNAINAKDMDFKTTSDHGLSKINCAFVQEEKNYCGVQKNQLQQENVDKSSTDITKFHDVAFPQSFLKTEPTIIDTFSEKNVKIEFIGVESEIKEEFNTSLNHGLSNIKCEFEEEETEIKYGVLEEVRRFTTDIATLGGASSQKTEPTIYSNNVSEFSSQCFNTKETLNIPMSIHVEESYKCESSVENLIEETTLNINKEIHTGENSYKSETCNKSCTQAKRHENLPTEVNYKCKTCNKGFVEKKHLNAHIKYHTGEKPFKCETCGKCFNYQSNLNMHTGTHTGEKPFNCVTCGKSFNRKNTLNVHTRIHTGEMLFKCETCSKSFSQKTQLNSHMKIHTGEKSFKCETCGKSFGFRIDLNNHMRIHTGEKPFKCETCSKGFRQRQQLKTHMKIHTGEKPFKCEICSKCFSQNQNFKSHVKIHTGEKPFKCEICSKCFSRKQHFKSHMQSHTEDYLKDPYELPYKREAL